MENLTEVGEKVVWVVSDYSECSIYQGSHRFNEIQQDDYLWKFVLISGRKSPQQNIRVIRGICGFKGKAHISTNFYELFVG